MSKHIGIFVLCLAIWRAISSPRRIRQSVNYREIISFLTRHNVPAYNILEKKGPYTPKITYDSIDVRYAWRI